MVDRSSKHSVSVSVRIRPGNSDVVHPYGNGIRVHPNTSFGYPKSVLTGSDQAEATHALAGNLVKKFCQGGLACTLMAYG